jgi:hypothetical protein
MRIQKAHPPVVGCTGAKDGAVEALRAERRRAMGFGATYSAVMGGLGWLSFTLTANAADLAPLDGARLRLAKIVTDLEGTAQQQAAFTASEQESSRQGMTRFLQEQPFRGRKPRSPKSSTPSEPAAPAPTPAAPAAQ